MSGGLLLLIAALFSFLSITSTILVFVNPKALPDFADALNGLVGSRSGVGAIFYFAEKEESHKLLRLSW